MTLGNTKLVLALTLVFAAFAERSEAVVADSAGDVCAPSDNPCNITEVVEVVDDSILDFGTRTVRLTGAGQFDFADGSGTVLCGSFQAESSTAISADDEGTSADTELIVVRARRLCSDEATPCIDDEDCAPGACSVGQASIAMGGRIRAGSDNPGTVVLEAADSVTLSAQVSLASRASENNGGTLSIYAATGDVAIEEKLRMRGGGLAKGGSIEVEAGRDVHLTAGVDLDGGVFDGGTLAVQAGRDASIAASVKARAKTYIGDGGRILVDAGRDVTIGGTKGVKFLTNGHSADGSGGSGGGLEVNAGGKIDIGSKVRMTTMGGAPDGFGGWVQLDAAGDVTFNGQVVSSTPGHDGHPGDFSIRSGGATTYGLDARVTAGGDSPRAYFTIESAGDLDFAGEARLGLTQGAAGSVSLLSGANATVSGTISQMGTDSLNNNLEVEACRITLTATAKLENYATESATRLRARESMRLLAGSTMTTPEWQGTNVLEYRTAAKPPVIAGTVSPAPILVLNGALTGCPVCGNSEIDQGETCDDGNTADSDGCDSACQTE